jgi:guanine deaminase
MVAGDIVIDRGRMTRVDEAALLQEIESEFRLLTDRYAEAEASMAPVLAAMESIYRRAQATAIAPDTYLARLTTPRLD